jgi:hypothetical protein
MNLTCERLENLRQQWGQFKADMVFQGWPKKTDMEQQVAWLKAYHAEVNAQIPAIIEAYKLFYPHAEGLPPSKRGEA